MRRILVAIKRVVDSTVRVRVKPDGSGVATEGAKLTINPFDEIALEEALRIRERGQADEVVAATVGPADCQQQLRTALAFGADRAVHVETDEDLEPYDVARLLHQLARRETPDVVLLGKQAIDGDNGQTGQMLAALWQRPQATYVSKLELSATVARATREVDAGLEVLDVDLPAVVTTDLRLNEPRYVKLPEIIKAKRKPLAVLKPSDLGITPVRRVKVVRLDAPPQRQKGVIVGSPAELVATLKARGLI
jgi:electron transfer flavoprotein beta subunit